MRTLRCILPPQLSLKKPVRISGPLVSSKMPMFLSARRRNSHSVCAAVHAAKARAWARYMHMGTHAPGRSAAASRTRSRVAPCASWSPWLKLRRAVFMPASMRDTMVGTSQQAGPMVQKILVFLSAILLQSKARSSSSASPVSGINATVSDRDQRMGPNVPSLTNCRLSREQRADTEDTAGNVTKCRDQTLRLWPRQKVLQHLCAGGLLQPVQIAEGIRSCIQGAP